MRTEHRAVATNFLAPDRYTEAIRSAGEGSCLRVYLDVAVVLNFLVDFLLILGTNRLAGFPAALRRAVPAALLGGVYGGICLIPGMMFLGNFLWRGVALCLMAVIAFGWNRSALQRGAVFVLLSMALGGIALGLGRGSFLMLVLAAVFTWLLCRMSFRGSLSRDTYIPVELSWGGRTLQLLALRDTGNTLRDPISGEQVLIAGADVGMALLGLTRQQLAHPVEAMGEIPGLRLIPYHGVGQPGGMLLALRFQNAKIGNTYGSPLVAFAPEVLSKGEAYQMLTGGVV